jgi:energy-coupling factor transporter transmembrane protein EcfT
VQAHAAKTFAVFLSCIPAVFESWNRIERAWLARGGKNGIAKMRALLPVFLSVCFHAASQKARALASREL